MSFLRRSSLRCYLYHHFIATHEGQAKRTVVSREDWATNRLDTICVKRQSQRFFILQVLVLGPATGIAAYGHRSFRHCPNTDAIVVRHGLLIGLAALRLQADTTLEEPQMACSRFSGLPVERHDETANQARQGSCQGVGRAASLCAVMQIVHR